MDNEFTDKVVVVTGAGGGFGGHFVTEFRSRGARVFCCDVKPGTLDHARAAGAHAEVVNLADRTETKNWIAGIEDAVKGPIDILVNNAGGTLGTPSRPIDEVLDAEWDAILANNVGVTFAVSRAAVPAMKRARKGRIVNISSGAGVAASRTMLHPYTAAKHAIVGLTRQMSVELGEFGITVNSVAPGFVLSSDYTKRQWKELPEDAKSRHLQKTSMRRVGQVEDISNAVLFLASDRSSWITGQVMSVDGGIS